MAYGGLEQSLEENFSDFSDEENRTLTVLVNVNAIPDPIPDSTMATKPQRPVHNQLLPVSAPGKFYDNNSRAAKMLQSIAVKNAAEGKTQLPAATKPLPLVVSKPQLKTAQQQSVVQNQQDSVIQQTPTITNQAKKPGKRTVISKTTEFTRKAANVPIANDGDARYLHDSDADSGKTLFIVSRIES